MRDSVTSGENEKEMLMTSKMEISHDKARGAEFSIGERATRDGYFVSLSGYGVEASRFLSADDLRDIRDWINRELGEGE